MAKSLVKGVTRAMSLSTLLVIGVLGVGASLYLYKILSELPDVSTLKEFKHSVATEVFSEDGVKIGEFTKQRRYPIAFDRIPKHVVQAFVAAEDSHFYEHKGIDPSGILRAIYSNITRGKYAQGGSTITQQVARSVVLNSREKNITRKIREIVLAWRMEKELSKNEILSIYLSEIYLGHGAFGIGAAAKNYFNKRVEDLTVAEGALLAGLPQRPNDWDPFRHPRLAKRRQEYVLGRMAVEKFLSQKDSLQAYSEPLKLFEVEDINNKMAPFFLEHVRQLVMGKYGSENILSTGYKVYTSLNYEFQKTAELSMNRGLRETDKRIGWRGVLAHFDSPIDVEAYVQKSHKEITEKITPVRILPTMFKENETPQLTYDLSSLTSPRSPYFGATPLKEGEYYKGVVVGIEDVKGYAEAKVGLTVVRIPKATMAWISPDEEIKNISKILKPGDLIEIHLDKIERKIGLLTASLEQPSEIQGAVLSFNLQTGLVQAMVGGKSFEESKFNCALQAKRQVGSTFKPILYAAAIDKGFSPSSIVTDSPIVFKVEGELDTDNVGENWRPKNYAGKFKGEIPLRRALIRSMNIPTVKLLDQISIDFGIDFARKMGITAPLPRDLSIALGSWSSSLEEVMRAYALFPRLGKPVALSYITKMVDGAGNTVEEWKEPEPEAAPAEATAASSDLPPGHVISPATAYVMTDLLMAVVNDPEGTGRRAAIGGQVAGKTGTSNDHRDAWFIGYSPTVISGVWIGYEKDKPLAEGETGGRAAAPIWADLMIKVKEKSPKATFEVPDGVSFAYVNRDDGHLATQGANRVRVAFRMGTVPDREGTNVRRIDEPGMRSRATSTVTAGPTEEKPPVPPKDETSDFIRQGYQ